MLKSNSDNVIILFIYDVLLFNSQKYKKCYGFSGVKNIKRFYIVNNFKIQVSTDTLEMLKSNV